MKKKRQDLILEIIGSREIETQEELAYALKSAGCSVTQAHKQYIHKYGTDLPEVAGCIAGDDTVMAVIKTVEDAAAVREKILDMIR